MITFVAGQYRDERGRVHHAVIERCNSSGLERAKLLCASQHEAEELATQLNRNHQEMTGLLRLGRAGMEHCHA